MSSLLGLEENKPASSGYDNVDPGPDPDWVVRATRGASWFYWIAGLSIVNTLIYVGGANVQFLGGLGVTQIANAITDVLINEGSPVFLRVFAIAFSVVAILGFLLAGYYANRLIRTAFLVGIIVYSIDTLIVLVLGDWFMAAFHAFALYSLIRGYIACRQIKAHSKQNEIGIPPPPPPSASAM
jgi:hypothetical protein